MIWKSGSTFAGSTQFATGLRRSLLSLPGGRLNAVRYRTIVQKTANTKMKRKAFDEITKPKPKQQRVRPPEPDYCDATPQRDEGGIVWPAPNDAMEEARAFIRNW